MPELGAYAARSLSAASRKAREDEVYFYLPESWKSLLATSWSSTGRRHSHGPSQHLTSTPQFWRRRKSLLPVAGYDPKHFLVTYLAAQHETEIWLAPLGSTRLLVPYRASISTPMGVGILEATKFVPSEDNAREGH